ncbi:Imm32 family immunity protein [Paractinoplanes hotanensis]|uniref:Uncharacterized protein n=1 Tax=Paractinoplanes hotanensis TaxID=2906497 RepID=A0ABT0YEW1_9ACTN|nr:hypothetical protein [Actinoplanes hotanensis]MCM4084586.1 hypothetical protein [Actinoplanes hotanensis]
MSGTIAELEVLARLLTLGGGSVTLDRSADPSPYDRSLSRIDIVGGSGPIVARCLPESDVLWIQGGRAQLGLLAEILRDFAVAGDVTSHLHIEYFPGHDYLDESADPLVVALR